MALTINNVRGPGPATSVRFHSIPIPLHIKLKFAYSFFLRFLKKRLCLFRLLLWQLMLLLWWHLMLPKLLYGIGPTRDDSSAIWNSHTSITIIGPVLNSCWHRRFLALNRRSTAFYCNLSGFLSFNRCFSRWGQSWWFRITSVLVYLGHFRSVCLIFNSLCFGWCVCGSWVCQVLRWKPLRG